MVSLDFDALSGRFLLPSEADPVFAGDIDRMFISLVPPGFDGSDTPLAAPVAAQVRIEAIRCDGPRAMLRIGRCFVPPHPLRTTGGYNDSYNQTPERLVEAIFALGYRGPLVHYGGMSHFPGLRWDVAAEAYLTDPAVPVCGHALAWHRDFLARAVALGFEPVLSLSFELLDHNCPANWAQRAADSSSATTGYLPPSTLLSPAHGGAMTWLQAVAVIFTQLAVAAGAVPRFQIGELWWWLGPDWQPCFYDEATLALRATETVLYAPVIGDIRLPADAEAQDFLDWCGVLLGRATLALRDAVPAAIPNAQTLLLFYVPQVLDRAAPDLIRANLRFGWAHLAFDVLQLEDYVFVTRDDFGGQARASAANAERLSYKDMFPERPRQQTESDPSRPHSSV